MKRSDSNAYIWANAVFKRPGYGDPGERLTDMDLDGVEVEVLYSEVSAFRYIPDLKTGAGEATRGFNDALDDFASTNRARLCVSYQIPIHDIDFAVAEVQRTVERGGKSLQLPVFRPSSGSPTTTTSGTSASFRPLKRRVYRSAAISASTRAWTTSADETRRLRRA